MTTQFDKHLADSRRLLLRPSRASLDDGDLSDAVIESIDSLVIDLNSTGQPWYLQSGRIDVVANQSVYPLNLSNFSRARYLYTVNDADSSAQRSPVEIVPYESLQGMFGGGDPSAVAVSSSTRRVANAASCYYLRESPGPGNVIEFAPVPNQSASYKLIYEPDVVRPEAKQDPGFRLAQFDGYVAALTVLRVLPQCKWKGLGADEVATRKKEIREARAFEIGSLAERRGYAFQFWGFMQSNVQRSEPTVVGWAQERW